MRIDRPCRSKGSVQRGNVEVEVESCHPACPKQKLQPFLLKLEASTLGQKHRQILTAFLAVSFQFMQTPQRLAKILICLRMLAQGLDPGSDLLQGHRPLPANSASISAIHEHPSQVQKDEGQSAFPPELEVW